MASDMACGAGDVVGVVGGSGWCAGCGGVAVGWQWRVGMVVWCGWWVVVDRMLGGVVGGVVGARRCRQCRPCRQCRQRQHCLAVPPCYCPPQRRIQLGVVFCFWSRSVAQTPGGTTREAQDQGNGRFSGMPNVWSPQRAPLPCVESSELFLHLS